MLVRPNDPEVVAPKACTYSPYSFWSGELKFLPSLAGLCPLCSVGISDIAIQTRTVAFINTLIPIQPLAWRTMTTICTRRSALRLVADNISAGQGTGGTTFIVFLFVRTVHG